MCTGPLSPPGASPLTAWPRVGRVFPLPLPRARAPRRRVARPALAQRPRRFLAALHRTARSGAFALRCAAGLACAHAFRAQLRAAAILATGRTCRGPGPTAIASGRGTAGLAEGRLGEGPEVSASVRPPPTPRAACGVAGGSPGRGRARRLAAGLRGSPVPPGVLRRGGARGAPRGSRRRRGCEVHPARGQPDVSHRPVEQVLKGGLHGRFSCVYQVHTPSRIHPTSF